MISCKSLSLATNDICGEEKKRLYRGDEPPVGGSLSKLEDLVEDIPNWESLEEFKSNVSSSLSMILSRRGSGEQWSGTLLVLVVEARVLCSIFSSPAVGAVVLKSLLESGSSKDSEVLCKFLRFQGRFLSKFGA